MNDEIFSAEPFVHDSLETGSRLKSRRSSAEWPAAQQLSSSANPDIFVNGKRFSWRRTVKVAPVVNSALSGGSDNITARDKHLSQAELAEKFERFQKMTLLDLAEALRPAMRVGNDEYVRSEPDVELAMMIRQSEGDELKKGSYAPDGAMTDSGVEQTDSSVRIARTIFGSDNRNHQHPHYDQPQRRQVVLQFAQLACSGTMIGTHTLVSAAHCFYSDVFGMWNTFQWGAAAADGDVPGTYPYGQFTCPGSAITIPTAWITSPGDPMWDFAVIDTSQCNNNPWYSSGHMGWWVNAPVNLELISISGYPGSALRCTWPQVCSHAGTDVTLPSSWRLSTSTIDITSGQSGTCWYRRYNFDYYCIGVQSGQNPSANTGRRFDTTFYNFVDYYAPYF